MMGNLAATAHPGDAVIGGVRARLLNRLFREVDSANHLFPSYRACIEAVIFEEGMFDAEWLDVFLPRPPVSVAAERDIEMVAEESHQRDVPPPPEIGDRQRLIGRIEAQW